MTHVRFNLRSLFGLSLGLLVMLASSISYGQAIPDGEFKRDGITSYIFSPMGITAVLVLALIAQLVYRQYRRNSNRQANVVSSPQAAQATKKRYDREEMSKLLKASASSNTKPRALEEAIRLSQLTQPDFPERAEHLGLGGVGAPETTSQKVVNVDESVEFEKEVVPKADN